MLLPKVLADFRRCNALARVDLGDSPIDVSKAFGREQMVEVFSLFEVQLQDSGHIIVYADEAALSGPALGLLIELVIKLNVAHGFLQREPGSVACSAPDK